MVEDTFKTKKHIVYEGKCLQPLESAQSYQDIWLNQVLNFMTKLAFGDLSRKLTSHSLATLNLELLLISNTVQNSRCLQYH